MSLFLRKSKKVIRKSILIFLIYAGLMGSLETNACSVLYYIDPHTGKIYVANNEDYWYDVAAYIQIMPAKGDKLARLWYGWDDFAQGGVNEAGLFFDGAVTPEQPTSVDNGGTMGNLGDDILALCHTVDEALLLLENREIALTNAHMMIGDGSGQAVVVEWIGGQRNMIPITNNRLVMTNFLLSNPTLGNHPCPRYQSIVQRLDQMEEGGQPVDLRAIGNAVAGAVQVPREAEGHRVGGTLYSSFINITDMEFILVYQLDNTKVTSLDLNEEFRGTRRKKIKLF